MEQEKNTSETGASSPEKTGPGPHYNAPDERLFIIRLQARRENMKKIVKEMHTDETLQQDEFISIIHREFRSACTDLWNESVKPWAQELYGMHR